jgi:P-aminobenzoate N-oxygenase AurF
LWFRIVEGSGPAGIADVRLCGHGSFFKALFAAGACHVRSEAMKGIDEYSRSYLVQWDKRATVRSRPRYRMTDAGQDVFPIALQPLASHEAVVAMGKDRVRELLVRTAFQWQSDVASLEVDVVAELCGRLANRTMQFSLPQSARHVALTIGTDEMYHAYAAREFIAHVSHMTGIDPGPTTDGETSLVKALGHVQRTAPPGVLREAEVMVLCFAEHLVTEELFGLSKDMESPSAFQIVAREHLMDEGRHQLFFQRLLSHMWREIDVETRVALGRLLPGFLDIFLADNDHFMEKVASALDFLGFDRQTSRRIADEAFDAQYGTVVPRKSDRKHAQHCLDLVRTAGMLTDGETRAALIESGWVAPDAVS